MKLIEANGQVKYLMKSGRHFTAATMPVTTAQYIISSGKAADSGRSDGYGIQVGDYFFEGTMNSRAKKAEVTKNELCEHSPGAEN